MIAKQDSKRITALRFLLIVSVIFIHNNGNEVVNTAVSAGIRLLCSEVLARTAVPLFFFFSGYLLFVKPRSYREVLKKKAKSLLLPYLIWNGLVLFFFWFGQTVPYLSVIFQNAENQIRNYTLYQWADAFLGLNYQGYPAAYQLWFIRDLIILNLLYPIEKRLVEKCSFLTLVLFGVLWLMQWRVLFFSSEATLFFLIGSVAAYYRLGIGLVDRIKMWEISVAYFGCVLIEWIVVTQGGEFMVLHKLGILLGCLFWLRISGVLILSEKRYQVLAYLSEFSFFVYAAHEPLLTLLRKLWSKLLPLDTTGEQLGQYFGLILLAGGISLCAGMVMRRVVPGVYRILTGGRS